jgi:transposase/regulator of replication initiation timing
VGLAEQVRELLAKNTELVTQNAELVAKVEVLEAELDKLRREMGRNSGNSGKPPSSDTATQRAQQQQERLSRAERRRQMREKAKKLMSEKVRRKPGKQPGAAGATLARAEVPDHRQLHVPEKCHCCGESLEGAEVIGSEARQVHDLPPQRLEVTEHEAQSRRCRCGAVTKAPFPKGVAGAACYGPIVRATAVYLMTGQHVPVARTAELLSQMCGAPVSTGWLAGLPAEAAGGLSGFLDELRAQLVAEDVLHADETSARVSGATYWAHVASTDLLTLLDCHEHRGIDAINDMAVLPFFKGVLVSDRYKTYWSIDGTEHALCAAHLLRDLAFVASSPKHRDWSDKMADLLVEAKDAVEAAVGAGRDGLNTRELGLFRARYDRLLVRGFAAVPARHQPGSVHRDAYNLLCCFRDRRHEVQRYWADPAVPATNNQAERDLRMVKLQRKISGCFRTFAGAKAFCAVRSYLQTARKHGVDGLDILVQLFEGTPWMPPRAVSPP